MGHKNMDSSKSGKKKYKKKTATDKYTKCQLPQSETNAESDIKKTKRKLKNRKHGRKSKAESPELDDSQSFDWKQYFKQICRLCMSRLKKDESEFINGKKSNFFVKKIFLCCDITIDFSGLPKRICNTCIHSLEQAYMFRLNCLEYNRKLLKIHNDAKNHIQPEATYTFAEKFKPFSELENDTKNNIQSAITQDSYIVNKIENVKTEIIKVKEEIIDVLDVEFEAQRRISMADKVQKEEIDGDGLKSIAAIKHELINESDDYFDDFHDVFLENDNIHINSIDSGNDDSSDAADFSCDLCPYACINLADYRLHVKSHCEQLVQKDCGGGLILFCQVEACGLEFRDFAARRAHVLECHREESFSGCRDICPYCALIIPLSYSKKYTRSIYKHIRVVHTDDPQVCNECGFHSKNPGHMKRHKMSKHNVAIKLPCPDCGKLITKKDLKGHIERIHNKNRIFPVCSCCDKKFFNIHNLNTHMRTHTGELPFKCPDCEQAFSHNVSMKTHRLKVHHIDMFKKKLNQWESTSISH